MLMVLFCGALVAECTSNQLGSVAFSLRKAFLRTLSMRLVLLMVMFGYILVTLDYNCYLLSFFLSLCVCVHVKIYVLVGRLSLSVSLIRWYTQNRLLVCVCVFVFCKPSLSLCHGVSILSLSVSVSLAQMKVSCGFPSGLASPPPALYAMFDRFVLPVFVGVTLRNIPVDN